MGAEHFMVKQTGSSIGEAFTEAVRRALYDHGHSGYTGTIGEKGGYVEVTLPRGINPETFLDALQKDSCEREHPNVAAILGADKADEIMSIHDDKWNDAIGFRWSENEWCFTGWASC